MKWISYCRPFVITSTQIEKKIKRNLTFNLIVKTDGLGSSFSFFSYLLLFLNSLVVMKEREKKVEILICLNCQTRVRFLSIGG